MASYPTSIRPSPAPCGGARRRDPIRAAAPPAGTLTVVERLTGTGIWSGALRYGDPADVAEAATELEQLGYDAMWLPDIGGEVFAAVENVLQATTRATVATGILNIWMHTPEE